MPRRSIAFRAPAPSPDRRLRLFRAIFLVLPSAVVLLWLLRYGLDWNAPVGRPWTIGERVITEPRVLLTYLGLLFVPLSTLGFMTIAPHLRADAAAATSFIRNVGGSISVAVFQALTVTNAQTMHASLAAHIGPEVAEAQVLPPHLSPDTTAGAVALAGFYDGVAEVPPAVKASWEALGFDEAAFLGDVGLKIAAGEKGRSVLEQIWARPTCEINGVIGGYTGEGFKTVIPAKASAKISFRLVAGQDPEKIRDAFRAHVRARIPADCSVEFKSHGASPAISTPADGAFARAALGALTAEWGKKAVVMGSGGSIPVVGAFRRQLDMDALLIGFAQTDDRIHSPNEKYDLSSFQHGIRSWIRILGAFAGT